MSRAVLMVAVLCAVLAKGGTVMAGESGFPRIANLYMAELKPDNTDVELRLLSRFDALLGFEHPEPIPQEDLHKLNDHIRRLREMKPGILILDWGIPVPYWKVSREPQPPESAFLHTPEGDRIAGWPFHQMLNLSREEALDALVAATAERVAGLEVDGFFVDCMTAHFDAWALNIESGEPVEVDADEDGEADDLSALDDVWVKGKRLLLQKLRERFGEKTVIAINGQRNCEYARPYVNGAFFEDDLDRMLDNPDEWPAIFEMYRSWCDLPHKPNCTTINTSSGIMTDYNYKRTDISSNCSVLEMGYARLNRMRSGLAAALMADGFFGYDLNTRVRGAHWWYEEYDAPLGRPLGEATAFPDGTWRREFEGGWVILNPARQRVMVSFDRRYRDFSTGWGGTDHSLGPQDGRILVPIGGN